MVALFTPYVNDTVLLPAAVGVTATVLNAVFIAATVPSNVAVELFEAPETRVVLPAVYVIVPALAVTVARTISPLAHVDVLMNDVPRPRLRADCAVAARVREKSSSVMVRDDIGSNSAIYEVRLHAS